MLPFPLTSSEALNKFRSLHLSHALLIKEYFQLRPHKMLTIKDAQKKKIVIVIIKAQSTLLYYHNSHGPLSCDLHIMVSNGCLQKTRRCYLGKTNLGWTRQFLEDTFQDP